MKCNKCDGRGLVPFVSDPKLFAECDACTGIGIVLRQPKEYEKEDKQKQLDKLEDYITDRSVSLEEFEEMVDDGKDPDPKRLDLNKALPVMPTEITAYEYQQLTNEFAVYPGARGANPLQALLYCTIKLNGEAGEIAELVGKLYRKYPERVDFIAALENHRHHFILEVGDVLWYVAQLCEILEISLNAVMAINIQKLRDRKSRDGLKKLGTEDALDELRNRFLRHRGYSAAEGKGFRHDICWWLKLPDTLQSQTVSDAMFLDVALAAARALDSQGG